MKVPTFLSSIGFICTAVILSILIFFGVQSFRESRTPVDIRLAVNAWPTARLLAVAEAKGFFQRRGIQVHIVDTGDDYEQMSESVLFNEVDGGAFVLSEPIILTAANEPMSVVLNIDYSAGADGIVATRDIRRVADLKGKTVAYQPGSFGHLLLEEALLTAGLTDSDIISLSRDSHESIRVFQDRQADAVVTYEPFLSQAAARLDSHILYTSGEAPGLIPDVVAFRSNFVATHRSEVQAFVAAWFDLIDYMNLSDANRREILASIAIKSGVSLKNVEQQFAGIHLFGRRDNTTAFQVADTTTSLYGSGRRFLNFFMRTGKIKGPVELSSIIDASFVISSAP